jgi:hypothetical protein
MIRRREFLQAGTALAALPGAAAASIGEEGWAGSLTRISFLEDVAGLAIHSLALPPVRARALLRERHVFLAGAGLQTNAGERPLEMAAAANRALRPVVDALAAGEERQRLEKDARILRELMARGGGSKAAVSESDLTNLLEVLSRRVMIGIHTYIPDDGDVEGWMERLIRLHDSAHTYWRALAAAYSKSRPEADPFYDGSEAILKVVSDPASPHTQQLREALAARPRSAYARALVEAHTLLLAL